MSFECLLINTCTIERYAEGAADAYGKPAMVWADHLADEDCRLMAALSTTGSGREIRIGAEVVIADYKLFLGNVDVTEQDRVVIDANTYEILLVTDHQDGSDSHHKELAMRIVR